MPKLKPCARCERELPYSDFLHPSAPFCKVCEKEAVAITRHKYSIIRAAHFRAKLRYKTKKLHVNWQAARSGSA